MSETASDPDVAVGYLTLLFEAEAEAEVRAIQRRVASLEGIEPEAYRPHITLTGHRLAVADLVARATAAVEGLDRFPVRLHHLALFPENRVLFLAPRITAPLLRLRETLLA